MAGTQFADQTQISQVETNVGLATNFSEVDQNKPRSRSKFKKYRDNEPQTPLKNDGLYADIYQGMYDNLKDNERNQTHW